MGGLTPTQGEYTAILNDLLASLESEQARQAAKSVLKMQQGLPEWFGKMADNTKHNLLKAVSSVEVHNQKQWVEQASNFSKQFKIEKQHAEELRLYLMAPSDEPAEMGDEKADESWNAHTPSCATDADLALLPMTTVVTGNMWILNQICAAAQSVKPTLLPTLPKDFEIDSDSWTTMLEALIASHLVRLFALFVMSRFFYLTYTPSHSRTCTKPHA